MKVLLFLLLAAGCNLKKSKLEFGVPVQPANETTEAVTFKQVNAEVLAPKCVTCHKAGEEAEKFPFVTREDLMSSSLKLVVPVKPDESLLYTITLPGARDMMPPIGYEPLSVEETEMLKHWILNGAK